MGHLGHIAMAFGAKPAAPKASIWISLLATEILDLLCKGFMAVGIERAGSNPSIPWSHGLFMSGVWSTLAGILAFIFYRDRRTSLVTGLLVFSHWVLDFITHPPDLPLLSTGSPRVGLGLFNSYSSSKIAEVSLLVGGIAIYILARKRSNQIRVW